MAPGQRRPEPEDRRTKNKHIPQQEERRAGRQAAGETHEEEEGGDEEDTMTSARVVGPLCDLLIFTNFSPRNCEIMAKEQLE